MKRMLKIKSGVWQWLALGCGCVGMMLGLGVAGDIDTLGSISDTQFAAAMALLLAALMFIRLGDVAEKREKEEAARRKKPSQSVLRTDSFPEGRAYKNDGSRHSA